MRLFFKWLKETTERLHAIGADNLISSFYFFRLLIFCITPNSNGKIPFGFLWRGTRARPTSGGRPTKRNGPSLRSVAAIFVSGEKSSHFLCQANKQCRILISRGMIGNREEALPLIELQRRVAERHEACICLFLLKPCKAWTPNKATCVSRVESTRDGGLLNLRIR